MSSIVSKEDYLKIVVNEDDRRLWGGTRLTPGYLAALDNMRRTDLEEWLLRQERVINKHCDDLEQKFHQQTQEAFSDAQQSLPDHVKKVLREKSLSSSRIKSPFILAHESGRVGLPEEFSGAGDARKSVWWKGWPFEGVAQQTGLWPHGRPVNDKDKKQHKQATSSKVV